MVGDYMKKLFLLLILPLMFIIPSYKAYAGHAMLCMYKGIINNNGVTGNLYIQMEDSYFTITLDTFRDFEGVGASNVVDVMNTPWYVLDTKLESATRSQQLHPSVNLIVVDIPLSKDKSISVYWKNPSDRTNLKNYGYCPSVVSFGCKNDLCYIDGDYDNDYEFVMGEAQSNSYDSPPSNALIGQRYANYYLVEQTSIVSADESYFYVKDNGKVDHALFSPFITASLREASKTCVTSPVKLDYITDVFNMEVEGYMSLIGNVEKAKLSKIYLKNGYDTIAKDFINNYKPGSTCYENNPSLKDRYDSLVDACASFLESVDDDSDIYNVNECEFIDADGAFAHYLNQAFRFIQYLGPILVIIYSIIEYIRVAATSDADLLKKTNKRTIIRLIFALLLFIVPIIIKILLNIFGFYGNCLDNVL